MTPHIDFDNILARLKEGQHLSETEIQNVRDALSTGSDDVDPYTLLHILGKAKDFQSERLIRQYLVYGLDDPTDDGMVRRIVVQALGQMWGLSTVFDDVAEKAFHDPSPFVRSTAATTLGYLGRVHPHLAPKAASLLLHGYRSELESQEVWESFYLGLLDLLDIPSGRWPHPGKGFETADVNQQVITQAEALAARGNKQDGHS